MIHQRKWSVWVLTALLWAPIFSSAQSTGVLSRQQLESMLNGQKEELRGLIHSRDSPPALHRPLEPDKLGHTLRSDLRENVLLADTQTRLQNLLASAEADVRAGDLPAAQVKAGSFQSEIKSEVERQRAIVAYWQEFRSPKWGDPDADIQATLHANGADWPRRNELDNLLATFAQQIASGDFVAAMNATFPPLKELLDLRNREQAELILSGLDSGRFREVRSASPRRCVPTRRTSESDRAKVDLGAFPSTLRYYPSEMKRKGITGSPAVFVVVRPEGCVERALILGPSPHPALDEAALRAAIDGAYLPAEKEGKRVRDGVIIRVHFTQY